MFPKHIVIPTDTLYISILTLHILFFSHSKTNLAKLGAPHPTPPNVLQRYNVLSLYILYYKSMTCVKSSKFDQIYRNYSNIYNNKLVLLNLTLSIF